MADSREPMTDERPEGGRETPRHGYQGDRRPVTPPPGRPRALTVAVSREAGARGGTIARRAAWKLGWQVYNQELLEYIAQEGTYRQDVVDHLPPPTAHWVEERLDRLLREEALGRHPSILNLARVVLALGAEGEVVLIGRGAGFILPRESTLHVRIIAPLADRVAYLGEWLRLSPEEAAEQVRLRDQRRAEFIAAHFHRQASAVYQYDLLLNSRLLGEDLCADLIAAAARAKLSQVAPGPARP